MSHSYIYDIRTSENALCTLVNFTGVIPPIWDKYLLSRNKYEYDDDLVEDVIANHGHMPSNYEDWLFTYFHITTSANACKTFKTYGILDLKKAYLCQESELREFLDSEGITIDIDNCLLKYKGRVYDISYSSVSPRFDPTSHACWSIGRKFYYDFTTCGFLSVWDRSPYGGYVHCRPEILSDIDDLLKLTLSQKWQVTHVPYESVAIVPGSEIVYDGEDVQSNKDKILHYLTMAYNTAFGCPSEAILLLKNNVQVPPERVVDIMPLQYWKT